MVKGAKAENFYSPLAPLGKLQVLLTTSHVIGDLIEEWHFQDDAFPEQS